MPHSLWRLLSRWPGALATLLAALVGLTVAPAFAASSQAATTSRAVPTMVKPGETITRHDSYKVKNLVSPGVYYKVLQGMTMHIVPTEQLQWPPPYRAATEKYSSQVRLSPNGRTMLNYVAGQPFPFLDPNDPSIATKIMWNNQFRPITTDDYDLRFYDCDVVRGGYHKPVHVIDYWQIGHYAGYDEVGRTEVNPVPIDPDYLKSNRVWLFALYPVLSPQGERGAGFVRWRYQNPKTPDAIWNYNPGSRRVRRLSMSTMGDAVTGSGTPEGGAGNITTFDPNHYSGFNAKIENYNYKFLGERSMLATVNAAHSPEITCQTDGGASACPENWEMRRLYIVQVTPRVEHNNSQAIHGKSILYIDSEIWFEPYVDEYDSSGRLWQNHIYWLTYRDRPVPDARVAIYPFKRAFVVGAAATDEQTGMATMCYLPGQHTPERECWYINMGAVSRDFFTPLAMRQAAQTGM